RRRSGSKRWSDPFVMADVPGFPDGNTALFIDRENRLWLFWPTILANTWQSCITNYRVSSDYTGNDGPPRWDWQGLVLLKPMDFQAEMLKGLEAYTSAFGDRVPHDAARVDRLKELIADKLSSRLGWQPRSKPTVLPTGRILLPLYSDTYSVGIMAVSDDDGKTWYA